HFALLSLLGVGGAITTAPEMHRYLVDEKNWLTDASFSSSIALAQSAPGPNVLFVALMGWNIGLRAGGGLSAGPLAWALGMMGVLITMVGIMLPSSILTYKATQWTHQNRDLRSVRAFKSGMAPIVIGLLVSTGWLLSAAHHDFQQDWKVWLVTAAATVLMLKTNLHLLWMIAIGGVLGGAGLL
ncbi:MAG: chromate transporter, partial [Betaproteobacteria bacterium]|nr:chromate transporter [Betaproteobacteria bacterium]